MVLESCLMSPPFDRIPDLCSCSHRDPERADWLGRRLSTDGDPHLHDLPAPIYVSDHAHVWYE